MSVVCSTCNDTHLMYHPGLERDVMCTACPVPCSKCREGGNGAYCTTTPCSCDCHAHDKKIFGGWNGMCPARKHGLDFEGQPCSLCAVMEMSDDDMQRALEWAKREVRDPGGPAPDGDNDSGPRAGLYAGALLKLIADRDTAQSIVDKATVLKVLVDSLHFVEVVLSHSKGTGEPDSARVVLETRAQSFREAIRFIDEHAVDKA